MHLASLLLTFSIGFTSLVYLSGCGVKGDPSPFIKNTQDTEYEKDIESIPDSKEGWDPSRQSYRYEPQPSPTPAKLIYENK